MKYLLLVLLILISFAASAYDTCPVLPNGQGEVNNCLKDVIGVVSNKSGDSDSAESAKAAAELFLAKNKERVDFEVEPAKALIERLKKFGNSDKLAAKEKAQLWLLASGIHGRLSDKLRANGGAAHGKAGLECLKKAIGFDRKNMNVSKTYGAVISGFCEKNFLVRKIIEKTIGISLSEEVPAAIKLLEENGQTSEPTYTKLKSF